MGELFTDLKSPQQKPTDNGFFFPTILSPKPPTTSLSHSITSNTHYLQDLLHSSGAILFRGFDVDTPSQFNDAVEAFGFDELPFISGAAPRIHVVGRVFTANEAPPEQKLHFHHEMSYVPEFPRKIFFYCEVEPKNGGETPIVLSHIVYEKMKAKYPEFVERLEKHGLIYTRVLGEDNDSSSPIDRSWKSMFSTDDKIEAEQRAAKQGMRLEWTEDGVRTIMGPIPAVMFDASRQCKVWFNSMVAAYTSWKDARNDASKAVTFGDGEPLAKHIIDDCSKILDDECVAIPWQKGDVLLLDNVAVQHSRASFTPPRRVLASFCK